MISHSLEQEFVFHAMPDYAARLSTSLGELLMLSNNFELRNGATYFPKIKFSFQLIYSAQKEGLLEFPQEDGNLLTPGEQVDPYIAHCKMHSDKNKMR
jgi:hypothetical protein